jgi:hypothetical protein
MLEAAEISGQSCSGAFHAVNDDATADDGTNRTNRVGLMMSAVGGRLEVAGRGSNWRY